MTLAQDTVNKLLDFNQKLDIGLLVRYEILYIICYFCNNLVYIQQDNVVTAMYSSSGTEQKMAQEVLTTLKEHPDAWQKVGFS